MLDGNPSGNVEISESRILGRSGAGNTQLGEKFGM